MLGQSDRGIPLTDDERTQRHYGTTAIPPKGTGLQSIGVLQSLGQGTTPTTSDLVGLFLGGTVGWYAASKWPNAIVKYIGILAGAELGIILSRVIKR